MRHYAGIKVLNETKFLWFVGFWDNMQRRYLEGANDFFNLFLRERSQVLAFKLLSKFLSQNFVVRSEGLEDSQHAHIKTMLKVMHQIWIQVQNVCVTNFITPHAEVIKGSKFNLAEQDCIFECRGPFFCIQSTHVCAYATQCGSLLAFASLWTVLSLKTNESPVFVSWDISLLPIL